MSQRKAKKPSGKPAEKKLKVPDNVRPHKIVGQLIGTVHNDDGEIIGEELMGEVAIYAAQFGEVRELVDEATSNG